MEQITERIMDTLFASTYAVEIAQVVADVFDSMLRCHAAPAPEPRMPETGLITAAVFYAGAWQGAIMIECTREEACAFAARLMRVDRPAVNDDDAHDALGEVVNIIGGNLKSVLPRGVGLSLPSVVKGKDYAYRICGNNRRESLIFDSCEGKFRVTLVQTAAAV